MTPMLFQRILVVGDLHGDCDKLCRILQSHHLTKEDLLLVAGDFGFVMRNTYREDQFLDYLTREWECTILFVPGNHEHYPAIASYPLAAFCGGRVREIRKNLYAAVSGEVYTVPTSAGEKRIFAFGGAASTDRGINPMRYATRFLAIDTEKRTMLLTRRDAYDYQKRIAPYPIEIRREACYRLIETIGKSLSKHLSALLPRIYGSLSAVLAQDQDAVRQSLAKMIAATVGEAYRKEVRTALHGFYDEMQVYLADCGYDSPRLALVLEEGTWFKEELPTARDFQNATENLKKHGNTVDYIITHTLPREMIFRYGRTPYPDDAELCVFLEWVMYETKFTHH